jgi:hypothetical protein
LIGYPTGTAITSDGTIILDGVSKTPVTVVFYDDRFILNFNDTTSQTFNTAVDSLEGRANFYAVSGTFEIIAKPDLVETTTITPKNGTSDIGKSDDPFRYGYFEGINTGDGVFKIGQNLRTSDAVSFASVNTGYGANEVYKHSYQEIIKGSIDSNTVDYIGAMISGEWKFVTVSAANRSYTYTLKTPSGGTYDVLAISNNYNVQIMNIGVLSGGTDIFYAKTQSDWYSWKGAIIIRKR